MRTTERGRAAEVQLRPHQHHLQRPSSSNAPPQYAPSPSLALADAPDAPWRSVVRRTGLLRSRYVVLEGESRRGRKDGYDTNMTGRGGQMGSRLQYLGVIGQYRKMMEDAITRESVPRDYHSQIKDYFQALDER
mgnify:CR=1 FL=1